MLKLLLLLLLLLLSLLTIFAAPTWHLWMLSVVVTEYSWVLMLLTMLLVFLSWKRKRLREWQICVGMAAIVLFALPIIQATSIAASLKQELESSFGLIKDEQMRDLQPFSLAELAGGIDFEEEVFESVLFDSTHRLSLDLYRAKAGSFRPCVIVVHGGSWKGGDSRQLPELNTVLARKGFHVAAVNYRKAPEHKFPAAVDDVKAALSFLKAHAAEYHIDTNNMFLLGRSAGAQIALLVAYDTAQRINGVVSYYGPADMVWGWTLPANPLVMDSRQVMSDYLGGAYEEVPEQYAASSATLMVNSNVPPTLMIHGGNDPLVAYEHNLRLIEQLKRHNVPYYLLTLPWATHGFDYSIHGPGGQLASYATLYFLKAQEKRVN